MSTRKMEVPENASDGFIVRIEGPFYRRVHANHAAICKALGIPRITMVSAIHHLLDVAMRQYEAQGDGKN